MLITKLWVVKLQVLWDNKKILFQSIGAIKNGRKQDREWRKQDGETKMEENWRRKQDKKKQMGGNKIKEQNGGN